MSEWRPIETAPRDGTVIDAYATESTAYAAKGKVYDTWYDDTPRTAEDEMARIGIEVFCEPVCWCPYGPVWWCRIEGLVRSFMPRFWRLKRKP